MKKTQEIEEIRKEIAASEFLNERQTAFYSGLAMSTLQSWRFRSCGIPYIKAGRKVLYKKSDVDNYMEKRKVQVND